MIKDVLYYVIITYVSQVHVNLTPSNVFDMFLVETADKRRDYSL